MQYLRNILKNNMKYPKVEGKEFDVLRKRQYDDFTESFSFVIKETVTILDSRKVLTKNQVDDIVEIASQNCAYMVVTNQ